MYLLMRELKKEDKSFENICRQLHSYLLWFYFHIIYAYENCLDSKEIT